MISWSILAVAVGLGASLSAFFMALWKLRKGVAPLEPLAGGLRWIAIATLLLYFTLIGAGSYAYFDSLTTQHALCTFRADLHTRVVQGEAYLKAHPEGFAGIPAPQIKETLDNQKRTVGTLSNLNC